MTKADRFLVRHGMEPERMEPGACAAAFLAHMERGLRGEASSIMMLPTYLTGEGELPMGEPVIAVDAGGTNLRAALVTLTEAGPRVEGLRKMLMPGSVRPVDWRDFLATVADLIGPMAELSDRLGFCYSFPAVITPERDGRLLSQTKQVKINGSEGKLLCAELNEELQRRGVGRKRSVLLNDTVATLLGGVAVMNRARYGGFAGLIYGTGVNTCCSVSCEAITKLDGPACARSMLINLESGGFRELPQGDADRKLDALTLDPGACIYEKMVSGAYFGELTRHTLLLCAEDGLLSAKMAGGLEKLSRLDSAETDAFWAAPVGENPLAALCDTDSDRELTACIIERLTDRAARLVCANLAAILLLTGEGTDPAKPVCVMTEGSTLQKSRLVGPSLRLWLERYLTDTLGRHWMLERTEHSNLLGNAAAVLLNT